jgi:hypothetical protein
MLHGAGRARYGVQKVFQSADNLCYTLNMRVSLQYIWQSWADSLQRWGVNQAAADALDAAGPLAIILAQMVHAGSALAGQHRAAWQVLADTLEDPQSSREFSNLLRGAPNA